MRRFGSAQILPPMILAACAALPAAAVVIRHDREDARYLELAKRYPAVCDVGGDGAGTLIAPRWVLTAAHVAGGINPFNARVGFGTERHGVGGTDYLVDTVIQHPGFAMGEEIVNDIALLRLARPVEGVEPVALYERADEVGKQVVFLGCGDSGTGDLGAMTADKRWRAATNTVLAVDGPAMRFFFDDPESPAVTEMEGFWGPGDSGGPVFIEVEGRPLLAGVSSHGDDDREDDKVANYGAYDVSFRVSQYRDWIRETMAARAGGAAGIPTPVLGTSLPDTPAGRCARAYLDARNSRSASVRQAFVDTYMPPPLDDAAPAEERVWWLHLLPDEVGELEVLATAEYHNGDLAVLTEMPLVEVKLCFTFHFDGTTEDKLTSVRLGTGKLPGGPAEGAPRKE